MNIESFLAAAEVIQGIILFCILGSQFFINYKVHVKEAA